MKLLKKSVCGLICLFFLIMITPLFAQTESEYVFPAGDFWSLDAGFGMSGVLVKGTSFQFIIDPKLWLSPPLMVGAKAGMNYSVEDNTSTNTLSNIFTFEGQVYMRWNFLRLGKKLERKTNIFVQGGVGLIAAYRGDKKSFDNATVTRGSLMADAALGVTIPLTDRWHIEPLVRGGYPHLYGFSLTAGIKIPLPEKIINTTTETTVTEFQYIEVMKTMPPEEIVRRVMITSVEFILFGPDIGRYNIGIDRDAQQLNELVLDQTAKMLNENPSLRVRIEGHANPWTINVSEIEDLQMLSAMRADVVSGQLRDRGVSEEQIVMIHFGGTRTVTNEWDIRNRNRRVELILIQVDIE